jgi:hypothetical protein
VDELKSSGKSFDISKREVRTLRPLCRAKTTASSAKIDA